MTGSTRRCSPGDGDGCGGGDCDGGGDGDGDGNDGVDVDDRFDASMFNCQCEFGMVLVFSEVWNRQPPHCN